MSTILEPPDATQDGGGEIRWKSWPLQRPLVALLAALGFLAVGALIYFVLASGSMVLLSLIALGLAGWRLFVPVDFTVDGGGVKQQWLGRLRYDDWSSFRAFSSLADGFLLWPSENSCPLDAVQGLFLPCLRQRPELLVLLRRHLVEIP